MDWDQGRIQDFLRELRSGADPGFLKGEAKQIWLIIQSQKSTEELPDMHAFANWESWQGTTGLLTALIEYLTVLLEHLNLLQSRWQGITGIRQGLGPAWHTLDYATAHLLRSATELCFYLLDVATKAIGQRLHDTLIMVVYFKVWEGASAPKALPKSATGDI